MAYTNFYLQSGASNLNAGSTTDNAAVFTYTAGTFVRATGVFTVATGNPSGDGVTTSMYASVYTTVGATFATFVAKITARDTTTITVDVATLKWGLVTTVSETALAATLKVGGAWANPEVLGSTGLGTFTLPVSTKVNVKQASYTIAGDGGGAFSVAASGTTTVSLWVSGYNTTPGDLDADTTNGLTKPVLALNSTILGPYIKGDYQIWSGLSITGSRIGTLWYIEPTRVGIQIVRCRVENTSSDAAAMALWLNSTLSSAVILYSWFKCPTTATTNGVVQLSGPAYLIGCVAVGGGLAGYNCAAAPIVFVRCTAQDGGGKGFRGATGDTLAIIDCTVSHSTGVGIDFASASRQSIVVNCLLATTGSYGLDVSGGNTNQVVRSNNDFFACTTANEHNTADAPNWFGQTDSSDPITSTTDMTIVASRNARNNGFPGIFENSSYSNYLDIGAVDHVDPASVAGGGAPASIFSA